MRHHRPQSDHVSSPLAPSLCLGTAPGARNGNRRRGSLPKPHYVSAITEGCKQHSRPAKAQRTGPTIALDLPSAPTSPLSVTQSKLSASITDARAPAKHFLDVCAGRSAPVSVGAIKFGFAVLGHLDSDPLLGGETHDLTDPNVVDYVLQLAWSGSIGFAAGASPRSDPHAEILANMEPLRQENILVHQNVTAILTAVAVTFCG